MQFATFWQIHELRDRAHTAVRLTEVLTQSIEQARSRLPDETVDDVYERLQRLFERRLDTFTQELVEDPWIEPSWMKEIAFRTMDQGCAQYQTNVVVDDGAIQFSFRSAHEAALLMAFTACRRMKFSCMKRDPSLEAELSLARFYADELGNISLDVFAQIHNQVTDESVYAERWIIENQNHNDTSDIEGRVIIAGLIDGSTKSDSGDNVVKAAKKPPKWKIALYYYDEWLAREISQGNYSDNGKNHWKDFIDWAEKEKSTDGKSDNLYEQIGSPTPDKLRSAGRDRHR